MEEYDRQRDTRWRLVALSIITLIAFLILGLRLWYLQVLATDEYSLLAEKNRLRVIEEESPRGEIADRNGVKLVTNENSWVVELLPEAQGTEELTPLSEISKVPLAELLTRWKKMKIRLGPLLPVPVIEDADYRLVIALKERAWEFPNIQVRNLHRRVYPLGKTASHVLGYVGEVSDTALKQDETLAPGDKVGKAGVEFTYDEVLRGSKSRKILEVNALGKVRKIVKEEKGQTGKNLKLTIDIEIQQAAENAVHEAIRKARKTKEGWRASAGAAIVMDSTNGDILALASYPDYVPSLFSRRIDPEDWKALNSDESGFPLHNRALMAGYPPASLFKPFVLVAALEEGMADYGSNYYCKGKWTGMGEDWPKMCWLRSGHGPSGLLRSLEVSCDTVYYEIGYSFYKNRRKREGIQKWARLFNYGVKSGVDLPFEFKGRIPDAAWKRRFNKGLSEEYKMWMPGDTVNMSIGQGDTLATPLQVAVSYAALANGGRVLEPRLGKEILSYDGQVSWTLKSKVMRKINAPGPLDLVKRGMERVVKSGTAEQAFREFPVAIAGKTGTAQIRGRGDAAWFASYAPLDNPRYTVVVIVEQGGSGGKIAGAAARNIYEAIFKTDEKAS